MFNQFDKSAAVRHFQQKRQEVVDELIDDLDHQQTTKLRGKIEMLDELIKDFSPKDD